MKRTVLTLTSSDHEALAKALNLILNTTDEEARVELKKAVGKSKERTYRVDVTYDTFTKDVVERLQKIDFTANVAATIKNAT